MSFSIFSPHLNHSSQDSLMRIFFRAPIFLFGLQAHSNKNSNTSPVSAKCRLQTGYKMQTVYKMQTKSLYRFFVRYVITCHLTTYQASRNRFSAIIFHDYLQYCGIFLARFLITVVLNLLVLRASWLVRCRYRVYPLNKSRC